MSAEHTTQEDTSHNVRDAEHNVRDAEHNVRDAEHTVMVIDIGGTKTRAARIVDGAVQKHVQCYTPTVLMSPDVSIEVLQDQLVGLVCDLAGSVSNDALPQFAGHAGAGTQIAIAISGSVSSDGRIIQSAPDIWGNVTVNFPLAQQVESRLARLSMPAEVRIASDVASAASRFARRDASADRTYALLMVRTGLSYVQCTTADPPVCQTPVLLGHEPLKAPAQTFHCTCGSDDHFTAYASGTGAVNVLICSALQNPKAFRSSLLFRLAAQKSETLRFEQRLALLRRHAVLVNAKQFVDEDVWRSMHDKYAEITPAEMQRWVFPVLLDAGMFIQAVNAGDAWALELLDTIVEPVARYLQENVFGVVDVVALAGGFARALGEAYRVRIAPVDNLELVQWAEDDDLDDLRGAAALLWPQPVVDLREPVRV